jgi:hypothetical protein
VVVVDVDGQRRPVEELGRDDAVLLRAVDRHEDTRLCVGRRLAQQPAPLELEEAVLVRQETRSAEHHHGVLPERAQREVGREQRSERVPVRVVVRGDDEALVIAQRRDDRLPVTRRHRHLRPPGPARR